MIKETRYTWKFQNILVIVISWFQHLELEVGKKCQYSKVWSKARDMSLGSLDIVIEDFQGQYWASGINTYWKEL